MLKPSPTPERAPLLLDEQLFSIHPVSAERELLPPIEIVVLPPTDPAYPQAPRPTDTDRN